jgi:AcrR family transcriptional regulator
MRPNDGESSRDRLLTATEEMLREAGMSGSGIKEIVARSGAPIGSLYHFFPGGKSQLVGEALRIHSGRVVQLLGRFFDGKQSAATAVRSLFNTAADVFVSSGADKGCAIGAVTLDLTSSDSATATLCRRSFDDWVAAIAPHLPFADDRTRRSFAVTVVATLEGAFVLSRAARSGQPFRDAGRWLSKMLSESEAVAPGRRRARSRGLQPRTSR